MLLSKGVFGGWRLKGCLVADVFVYAQEFLERYIKTLPIHINVQFLKNDLIYIASMLVIFNFIITLTLKGR